MTDKPDQEDEIEPVPSALSEDALPELSNAKVPEGINFNTPKLPDDAKVPEGINFNIPELPDYAKMLEGINFNIPELPDYAKMLEGINFNMPKLPDYVKVPEGVNFNIPELPDYARVLKGSNFNIPATKTENIVAPSGDQSEKLLEEIAMLRKNAAEHAKALKAATAGSEDQKREIEQLKSTVDQLKEKQRL